MKILTIIGARPQFIKAGTVNPLHPKEIADAINYIISNPREAEKMGTNGRKAVLEKYNWGIEEKKLLDLYKRLGR